MERKELALVEPENGNGSLPLAQVQQQTLHDASALAQHVAKIVRDNGLSKKFGSSPKEHVFVEGWLTISRVNNEAPHAKIETVESIINKRTNEEHEVIKARAWITDAHGNVVSEADGYCSDEEGNWRGKPFYARASMAQTRAIGKAMRLRHAWVMVMAGFSPTPAEEMDGVMDDAPKRTTPAKIKETKENGKKVYQMSADDDRVPASVTDSQTPAEPLVVPDSGLEGVVLKAYSAPKTDKKGQSYRSLLLVAADNSEDWWYCNHAESMALDLKALKGKVVNAKLEVKGDFKLCHKIEVPNG